MGDARLWFYENRGNNGVSLEVLDPGSADVRNVLGEVIDDLFCIMNGKCMLQVYLLCCNNGISSFLGIFVPGSADLQNVSACVLDAFDL